MTTCIDNRDVKLAELEKRLETQEDELEGLRRERDFYRALLENSGIGVMACGVDGHLLVFNRILREWCELDDVPSRMDQWSRLSQFRGLDGTTPIPMELAPLRCALAGEKLWEAPMTVVASGSQWPRPTLVTGNALYDDERQMLGAAVFFLDVSERKRAEEALRESLVQEELARARAESLEELSTPLIPISDEVLVMPLVGALDEGRFARMTEVLLNGISAQRARTVILDVTGVPSLEAHAAEGLIRVARATRLLGAQVVITGIRPEVSRMLVNLEIDLSGLVTYGSLQAGIAFAMGTRKISGQTLMR